MNMKMEDDQANELRNLFDEINKEDKDLHSKKESLYSEEENNQYKTREVDILNLPPRSEIHIRNSRTHLKIGKPLIRFLLVVILLTVIIVGAYYYWGDEFLHLLPER